MESTRTESGLSRRDFAWLLGSLGPLGLVSTGFGQDEKKDEKKAKEAEELAAALEVICRQKFGKILSDEQLKRVHRAVVNRRALSEALRRVPLQNGDDPAAAFRADVP